MAGYILDKVKLLLNPRESAAGVNDGSQNDLDNTFYWSGKPNGERRKSVVGFAIKRDIVAKLTDMTGL